MYFMSILCDKQIEVLAIRKEMIKPFIPRQINRRFTTDVEKVISYGLSSYGYDIRLKHRFFIPTEDTPFILDPKDKELKKYFKEVTATTLIIPPHGFVLGMSDEYFKIPRDVMVVVVGKSTYARCGVVVNVTPLESEWEGFIVIEISNTTPHPVKIYGGEGIAQALFFQAEKECEVSYADRKGKYQDQKGIEVAKV